MSRAPVRRSASAAALEQPPACPRNDDCQREQARALTRLADTAEAFQVEFHQLKPLLENIGEIAGKWLKFCGFIRKWVPKLWWLPLLIGPLIGKGSNEVADALFRAATAWLTMQAGGGA